MLWCKIRSTSDAHALFDTARGFPNWLVSNTTGAQNAFGVPDSTDMVATTTGFSMKNISSASNSWNASGANFASWTFRKQPKFFDVVTYTGNGSNRTISHSLGSVPGCIIVKKTNTNALWAVYHRSLTSAEYYMELNTTVAQAPNSGYWNSTAPTSTVFSVGTDSDVNASGGTYVAYLWAHDAGGFGLTGSDNVISCGTFTGNSAGDPVAVNLGYEAQWVMHKRTNGTGDWAIFDSMRGAPTDQPSQDLFANLSNAEATGYGGGYPTSTGFVAYPTGTGSPNTYIYIAIRRGPMKVPTLGTNVFESQLYTGTGATLNVTGPTNAFQYDSLIQKGRSGTLTSYAGNGYWVSKLQQMSTSSGLSVGMGPAITAAEVTGGILNYSNVGFTIDSSSLNISGTPYVNYWLRRAPSFFDVVCYIGTGSATTVTHNLGVAPELIIVKTRSSASTDWKVYSSSLGNNKQVYLNYDYAVDTPTNTWNNTTPTSSVFSVGGSGLDVNNSGSTYVAYLFATCAGVSKVGSYTGTGATLQIDCGFTGGARFVLIKRTSSTGGWYVWDSARGIVSGNDPYLLLNSTAAEVTSTDYVDTYSAGFEISSTAPAAINSNGGSFIFLAIA